MATPIEQIKQRLSIVDVVGSYVALKLVGKHYKGKSPFTNERTPSFFVSPDRGMYYCFSSGKGGDMFTFIQEMEGVDFKGALKVLAERAGVELVPVDPKTKDIRERLFALVEDAAAHYAAALTEAPTVIEYLTSRGLRLETIKKWRIGHAKEGWRNLKDYLKKKGYTDAELYNSGLLKKQESAENGYDVFRNRVMFPIADTAGRVVGFSGRALGSDPATPKYVNSPETELFVKSHVLFGFSEAKHGIRTFDFSLVVEGQFDLVLSHQAGYTNTVALSGTALSLAHVELLQRLSNKVVLALDADTAGIASVKRCATVMLKRGMDVKVARILGGKDPADLVREDPKLLKQSVGAATHVIEFLLAVLRTNSKDERAYRLRVQEEVLPFIVLMPNKIDQEHFEEVVAKELNLTKDAIIYEVARLQEASTRESNLSKDKAVTSEPVAPRVMKREEDLIAHLYGMLLWQAHDPSPRINVERLRTNLEIALGPGSMQSLHDWSLERQNEAIFKVETMYTGGEDLEAESSQMLYELYQAELRRRLTLARITLKEAEISQDTEARTKALAACNDINETLKKVSAQNPFLQNL